MTKPIVRFAVPKYEDEIKPRTAQKSHAEHRYFHSEELARAFIVRRAKNEFKRAKLQLTRARVRFFKCRSRFGIMATALVFAMSKRKK